MTVFLQLQQGGLTFRLLGSIVQVSDLLGLRGAQEVAFLRNSQVTQLVQGPHLTTALREPSGLADEGGEDCHAGPDETFFGSMSLEGDLVMQFSCASFAC